MGKLSYEEKTLAYIFSYYRLWQNPRDFLWVSARCSDNYYGSYKIISVTLKRLLKTQNKEKGKLSNEAKFLADCSRIIECDKPQKTFFEAQHGVLTITMEVTRSFL